MTQTEPYEGSASESDVRQALEVVKGFGQMALGASGVELGAAELGAIGAAVDDAVKPGTTVEIRVKRDGAERVLARFHIVADPLEPQLETP